MIQTTFAEQEVDFGAYWLAGTCELDIPEEVVEDSPDRYIRTRYLPLGVVVGIVPWNCTRIRPQHCIRQLSHKSSPRHASLRKASPSRDDRQCHNPQTIPVYTILRDQDRGTRTAVLPAGRCPGA